MPDSREAGIFLARFALLPHTDERTSTNGRTPSSSVSIERQTKPSGQCRSVMHLLSVQYLAIARGLMTHPSGDSQSSDFRQLRS